MIKWFSEMSYRTFFYRSIAALVLGVFLILNPRVTMNMLVQLIGAFILFTGLATLIVAYRQPHNLFLSFGGISAIVCIVFGAILLCLPGKFANMIIVLFGLLLLVVGLFQIVNTANMRNEIKNFKFYMTGGSVTFLAGMVFLLFPNFIKSSIGIFLGFSLIIYAINELGLGLKIRGHFNRANVKVEDVSYEKIEDVEEIGKEK